MSQIVIRNPGTPINQIYCKVYDFHWNFHSEIGEELFEEIILPFELHHTFQRVISNNLLPDFNNYFSNFLAKRKLQKQLSKPRTDNFSLRIRDYIAVKGQDPHFSNKEVRITTLVERKKPSYLYIQVD